MFTALFVFKTLIQSLGGTLFDTKSASYTLGTFRLFGRVHTHFADLIALATGDALALVTMKTHSGYLIESTVDGSKRADVLAEGSIDDHRKNYKDNENCYLPGVKKTDCLPETFTHKHKRNTAFKSADGTDVFAKPRIADTNGISYAHWKNDNKYSEDYILELSEYSVALESACLFDEGNLMK